MKTNGVANVEKGEHLLSADWLQSGSITMNINVGIPKKVEKYLVSGSSEKV